MMKNLLFGLMMTCLFVSEGIPAADPGYLFQIHGSNTIGTRLGPELAKDYLISRGCNDVVVDKNPIQFETLIHCTLLSERLAIKIVSKGSSTGFDAMNAGLAQIVASSRKVKSGWIQAISAIDCPV